MLLRLDLAQFILERTFPRLHNPRALEVCNQRVRGRSIVEIVQEAIYVGPPDAKVFDLRFEEADVVACG